MKKLTQTLPLLLLIFSVAVLSTDKSAAQIPGVEHVVLIGSDGFSAEVLRENPGMFPNVEALMARGSSTLECRTVLPSSSAVNWASHLMGAGPELHGYTTWGSKTPDLPSRELTENGTFPCIVWSVRQKYPQDEIGVFYGWDGIGYLFDTIAVSENVFCKDDREMTDKAVEYLKKKPRFAFFYLVEPDHTGHTLKWQSEEYKTMCRQLDGYIGEIIAGVEAAGMKDNTVVIFTSDHGGLGLEHGGKSMSEMQVPYVLAGPGVKKGFKITESMMNFDDAATIAHILGTERPQVWIGRPVMSAFEKKCCSTNDATFTVTLDENPTTGYQWSVGKSENIELLDEKFIAPKTQLVGAGGKKICRFAVKKVDGKKTVGKVTMEYKRSWEEKPLKVKRFSFTAE